MFCLQFAFHKMFAVLSQQTTALAKILKYQSQKRKKGTATQAIPLFFFVKLLTNCNNAFLFRLATFRCSSNHFTSNVLHVCTLFWLQCNLRFGGGLLFFQTRHLPFCAPCYFAELSSDVSTFFLGFTNTTTRMPIAESPATPNNTY